ncbi:MAG: transcriptional regulator [Candidatus Riflebacteria bacterium RBG_13_59_9]|nr:MAG: transcriptional regulator [Candidatus Riflebacteria bacterium RBG_13_59_9]
MRNKLCDIRAMAGGITQKELAQRTGVTRQTIISIEAGHYNPSVKLALKLARALLVRVEDIFSLPEGNDGEIG